MLTMETRRKERNKELDMLLQEERSKELNMLLRAAVGFVADAQFSNPPEQEKALRGLIYTVERIKEEVER